MKLKYAVALKATPEEVWYWLGNPEKAMMWQTNVTKGEIIKQTPEMVGTTFRETIEENGGSTEMEGVITAYKENQVLAMNLNGKYNVVDVQWLIMDMGDHTRLTADFNVRFKAFAGVLSIVIRPVFKKNIINQLQVEFTRLKELCESNN